MNRQVVRDAVVQPLAHDQAAGVFEGDACLESSLLSRRYRGIPDPIPIISAARSAPATKTLDRSAIFAGYLFDHFGHFLLESLSRLWITREDGDTPLVWCVVGHQRGYTPWQREILDLLGVTNDAIILDGPTGFSSLTVPEAGWMAQYRFDREHADFLAAVEPSPVVSGRRCWVSRSNLPPHYGALGNEKALEAHLREHGWDILHPEDHPVEQQLARMSSSEVLAGLTGSAFHSLVLLKELRSQVKLIETRWRNDSYETIAAVRGFDQRAFPVSPYYYRDEREAPPGELTLNDLIALWTGSKYPTYHY